MPRRLFVHCGPPKTGTSAIQAYLRDTPPTGLTYPQAGQWPDGAHHKLIFALQGVSRRGSIDIPPWDEVSAAHLAEIDAAEGDVVISSEHIRPPTLPKLLDDILPRLSRSFDEIVPIVVLRHPLERAASSYNQNVKDPVSAETRLPDQFLAEDGPGYRLGPLIRKFSVDPYPARFLGFHPPATLIERFLAMAGHEGTPPGKQRRNASINGYGLVTLLAAHRIDLAAPDRARLFDALRADKVRKIWAGPSFPFSPEATQQFMDTVVQPDLARVRRRTGIDLTALHATPPDRFALDTDQQGAVRAHFAGLGLDPEQHRELEHLLQLFSAPATGPLDGGRTDR